MFDEAHHRHAAVPRLDMEVFVQVERQRPRAIEKRNVSLLEVQQVADVYHPEIAEAFGLRKGDIQLSIHCGSRGLGHQIGTEFLKKMARLAKSWPQWVSGERLQR